MRTQSEYSYLLDIGQQLMLKEKQQIDRTLTFLDGVCKVAARGNYATSNMSTCDSNYFLCGVSTSLNYSNFNSIYATLKGNSQLLTLNHHSTNVFLTDLSSTTYLNPTQLGISSNPINTSLTNTFINTYLAPA